ncbi:MAG: RNA polymerase sigma factor [Planctomycetota bacterium]
MSSEDLLLLRRCANGEDEAWTEFLSRYQPFLDFIVRKALVASGRGKLPTQTKVEEIRDELIAWLLENDGRVLKTYRGEAKVTSWLGVVAGRRARRLARRGLGLSSKMVSLDALTEDAATHLSVEQAAADEDEDVRAQALARVASALDELPERDKALLRGAFFDDRSYDQLAQDVGVKPDSIGQLLYRAKDKLKKKLGGLPFFEKLSGLALAFLSSLWDLGK